MLRAEWRRKLRHGDHLVLSCLPAGGGGGAGSNPMRTILTIALLAFSGQIGLALAGNAAGTVLFGSFTIGKALGLGVMLAGSAAINALMPQSLSAASMAPSPTYALTAQGNAARLDQPIPVQYGRMLSWPDLAAQPYTEYSGSEQYLYQLLCLGCGGMVALRERLESRLGVPVVEAVPAGIVLAEGLARCGLRTSKARGYKQPEPNVYR